MEFLYLTFFYPRNGDFNMEKIIIRKLKHEDILPLRQGFLDRDWDDRLQLLERYLRDQAAGTRQVFVAELDGAPVGYVTLLPCSEFGPFAGRHLPYISDFNVFEKCQGRGIGSALLDAAEASAAEQADTVTLGVGLHSGYGAAQRLYVRRGYVPDGSGVWFENRPAKPYSPCFNGDDLILYLSKSLK